MNHQKTQDSLAKASDAAKNFAEACGELLAQFRELHDDVQEGVASLPSQGSNCVEVKVFEEVGYEKVEVVERLGKDVGKVRSLDSQNHVYCVTEAHVRKEERESFRKILERLSPEPAGTDGSQFIFAGASVIDEKLGNKSKEAG